MVLPQESDILVSLDEEVKNCLPELINFYYNDILLKEQIINQSMKIDGQSENRLLEIILGN